MSGQSLPWLKFEDTTNKKILFEVVPINKSSSNVDILMHDDLILSHIDSGQSDGTGSVTMAYGEWDF